VVRREGQGAFSAAVAAVDGAGLRRVWVARGRDLPCWCTEITKNGELGREALA